MALAPPAKVARAHHVPSNIQIDLYRVLYSRACYSCQKLVSGQVSDIPHLAAVSKLTAEHFSVFQGKKVDASLAFTTPGVNPFKTLPKGESTLYCSAPASTASDQRPRFSRFLSHRTLPKHQLQRCQQSSHSSAAFWFARWQ